MPCTQQQTIARCAWMLSRQLSDLHDILCQIYHEEFLEFDCQEQQQYREQEAHLPF